MRLFSVNVIQVDIFIFVCGFGLVYFNLPIQLAKLNWANANVNNWKADLKLFMLL